MQREAVTQSLRPRELKSCPGSRAFWGEAVFAIGAGGAPVVREQRSPLPHVHSQAPGTDDHVRLGSEGGLWQQTQLRLLTS